jgi:hypothetical protein
MKRINQIRAGLSEIPHSRMELPPEPSFRGEEPGVTTTPIWTGDYHDPPDETQEAAIPEDAFSDSEEEDENGAGMAPDFTERMPKYCVIEEQLANAYMLKAFRTMKPAIRIRGKQRALREFTKVQPAGYCVGWRVRSQDWNGLLPALAEEYGRRSTKGAANHYCG